MKQNKIFNGVGTQPRKADINKELGGRYLGFIPGTYLQLCGPKG